MNRNQVTARSKTYAFAMVAAMLTGSVIAEAAPVIFTHEGSGSGSIAGSSFAEAAFVITAVADTNDRVSLANGFAIQHDSASIAIDGVGVFDFVTPTRTFVNNPIQLVGFSRSNDGGTDGFDLYNGPTNPALLTYDLLNSLGPITGRARIIRWDIPEVITSGGVLFFADDTRVDVVFTAQVIPEPSTFCLASLALLSPCRHRKPSRSAAA